MLEMLAGAAAAGETPNVLASAVHLGCFAGRFVNENVYFGAFPLREAPKFVY